jgi:pyruvate kinase
VREKNTKIIVTLGPSTNELSDLAMLKERGVDFVRTNMSHSSLAALERFVEMSRVVGIPFIIDTEGSQVRTALLEKSRIFFPENRPVRLWAKPVLGNENELTLRPGSILEQLQAGDLIHVDFDTLIMRVIDVSTVGEGYITARTVSSGSIGENKAVVIDPLVPRRFDLPPLSDKDYESIEIGLRHGIGWIAVSFVRSGAAVDEVRQVTRNRMKIISKIECVDALEHLDEIIARSDALLIDRGDLSKEIPLEKIPFTQKIIISRARRQGIPAFVATNLLETMVEQRKPTRAEVHDVMNTIIDGAAGLTLAAETAIGKYPVQCVNVLNRLIRHAETVASETMPRRSDLFIVDRLEDANYLLDQRVFSTSLVEPHGGKLVDRTLREIPSPEELAALPSVRIDVIKQMDVEQIAAGTYSPLEGFMGQADLECVLNELRLASGTIWPLPILLDVPQATADGLDVGQTVALVDERDDVVALLRLREKYALDREQTAKKLYGTLDRRHPGVQMIAGMHPILLAGEVDLIKRRESETKAYEQTPRQIRRLFEERGWGRVLGFHTRNVIHRGHEYVQLRAMEEARCDGLFVHPVIGKKKAGDYHPSYIIRSYETMLEKFYPQDKVVFATFSTFSRYAGPREALFTALCRKNFGCSHFVVGRDHTGVGNFYEPDASQKIFDTFPELGITPVRFNEIYYSSSLDSFVEYDGQHEPPDKLAISASEARRLLVEGQLPPEWLMRPEIAAIVLDALKKGEEVFVPAEE